MALYYIYTVDGDWDEYFLSNLPDAERQPDKKTLINLVRHEIKLTTFINGRLLHFVHTSSVASDFFLQPEFISLWKDIETRGGNVGVHCHTEDLFHEGRFNDQKKMEKSISSLTSSLADKGINPISYRGGYMAFCEKNIPILEKNGLLLDFSCDPGRYLRLEEEVVADWRGAPGTHYRMSYADHRKRGNSEVIEIPLGKGGGGTLYIETTSLLGIWKAARALAKKAKENKNDIIVSILSHTYEFNSFRKRLKIKSALLICNKYGIFVNDREALEIVNQKKTKRKE